jgi:hypothetical protein
MMRALVHTPRARSFQATSVGGADCGRSPGTRRSLSVEKFDLHTAPELPDHRVVVTVAHRAHRRHQSGVNGSLGERSRRELLGFKGSSQHLTIELALHVIAWLPETAGRELEETSTLDTR